MLRCVRELCRDGQMLVDLFVNYDCDLEGSNLYERLVNGLVRMAQAQAPAADQGVRQLPAAGGHLLANAGLSYANQGGSQGRTDVSPAQ